MLNPGLLFYWLDDQTSWPFSWHVFIFSEVLKEKWLYQSWLTLITWDFGYSIHEQIGLARIPNTWLFDLAIVLSHKLMHKSHSLPFVRIVSHEI